MKKLLFYVCIALVSSIGFAQIDTPAPSPSQKIEQMVGLTNVTLEYSRPSMKGRKIFGDLVPYDKLWRTGANANTKITFGNDVNIGGSEVKAGTYAVFTKPGMQSWEVYFYADASNWGTPQNWDEAKVAAKVKAQAQPMPMNVESFTMSFDDVKSDTANLGMMWENVYVAVPIGFMTDKMVTASIEKVMGGPTANDYFNAAVYYLTADKDINKAKTWIDKAIAMSDSPAFWYYRQQSLIYAKSGDKKGAINAAQKSLQLATEAGNDDYIALNKKSLAEWGVK
jgi:Protein of unknown function (DUF2911)